MPLWVDRPWLCFRSVSVGVRGARENPANIPPPPQDPVQWSTGAALAQNTGATGPLELCHVVGLLLNGEPASKLETTLAKQETDKQKMD